MKREWCLSLIIALICIVNNSFADNGEKSFYQQISSNVVRLEFGIYSTAKVNISTDNIKYNPKASVGTAFFVTKGKKTFIVTARHVADQKFDLHARVLLTNKNTNKTVPFILNLPKNNWKFHPNEGDKSTHYVDVAAMKIGMNDDIHQLVALKYDPINDADSQLKNIDAQPPEEIIAFGFPENIGFELTEQKPMGRSGIVSLQSSEKFIKLIDSNFSNKFLEEKCLLIDAKIFGGNSGGPVINKTTNLIGLVISSNDKYSFAVIEPVSRIREVIDIADSSPFYSYPYWLPLEFQLVKDTQGQK